MKPKIIAQNKQHLMELIKNEIQLNGYKCNLNHIEISQINDLSYLFNKSKFNGDISKWNTSNVNNMSRMFYSSIFNGDISNWDVSNVESMSEMFAHSKFKRDISNWKPYKLEYMGAMFHESMAPYPYWAEYYNYELSEKEKIIKAYHLEKELKQELSNNTTQEKRMKL
jgi:surface protein